MAWLSGLAGKAEEVLNNIDRSTAAVLKKDENNRKYDDNDELVEVRSLPQSNGDEVTVEEFIRDDNRQTNMKSSYANKMTLSAPTTPSHKNKSLRLQSNSISWHSRPDTTVDVVNNLVDTSNGDYINGNEPNNTENHKGVNDNGIVLDYTNQSINASDDESNSVSSKKETAVLLEKQQQKETEYLKEIESLKEQISTLISEKSRLVHELSELSSTLEKTRTDLMSIESELKQHRARALKTLQDRDKLIEELRNNPNKELNENSNLVELNQLRQERDTLREENYHISEKLRLARQEAMDAELSAEKLRQEAMETSAQARETIAIERRKRLELEEEAKLRKEEAKALREELTLQQNTFAEKITKQESEIVKLRSRLSSAIVPNADAESRITSLTRTLVLKQQEVEHLTTDRNALRLQLERLEHEYQNWRKNVPFNNVNDTDDAKALLPSFLVESPFDTGVTRRVKRAYSTLDAVGIRIGVFLRRYPLARILVLLYMALLQFWVLFVLFSQSPEAQ